MKKTFAVALFALAVGCFAASRVHASPPAVNGTKFPVTVSQFNTVDGTSCYETDAGTDFECICPCGARCLVTCGNASTTANTYATDAGISGQAVTTEVCYWRTSLDPDAGVFASTADAAHEFGGQSRFIDPPVSACVLLVPTDGGPAVTAVPVPMHLSISDATASMSVAVP